MNFSNVFVIIYFILYEYNLLLNCIKNYKI